MILKENNKLIRRDDKELLCIEPWGPNSFRVRATQRHEFIPDDISSLLEPEPTEVEFFEEDGLTGIRNGKITCKINAWGKLAFYNQDGKLLLEEFQRQRFHQKEGEPRLFASALEIQPRSFNPHEMMDNYHLTARFESDDQEKIFGMGQYQDPYLDVKGSTLELAHRNSQACVPFIISNKGYGFLWNNPGIGQVTFGKNVTAWEARSTKQLDYWITAGDTPAEIERAYADVSGKVPMMPEYGMGFWQCKLRYQTQDELLGIAREYKKRGIPLDVIVVDFFHWPHQGDFCFDPDYWPDPEAMVKELNEMGIQLMVSIWPTAEPESPNYAEMEELGLLTRSERSKRFVQLGNAATIDVTNPETRKYVWGKIKQNYYDKGIHIFWQDEAEPELNLYEFEHYRYFRGADMEVGNIYPREYARMCYEGMEAEGQKNIMNLLRCAFTGSQRYGALVWSGDIDSSFKSLRNQLRAGLNMGIAGIPWWTTDIGGFHGGDIRTDEFKEVLTRWFEFGAFCPVMRLHGVREPHQEPLGKTGGGRVGSGAANEIWSYGDQVYEICKKYIELREKMRPYVREVMKAAHEKGDPVMRPLFYEFPDDKTAWEIDDSYMFGPDLLVAPILYEGQRERTLYLPAGQWRNLHDGKIYEGCQNVTVDAPIDVLPVFARNGKLEDLTL